MSVDDVGFIIVCETWWSVLLLLIRVGIIFVCACVLNKINTIILLLLWHFILFLFHILAEQIEELNRSRFWQFSLCFSSVENAMSVVRYSLSQLTKCLEQRSLNIEQKCSLLNDLGSNIDFAQPMAAHCSSMHLNENIAHW